MFHTVISHRAEDLPEPHRCIMKCLILLASCLMVGALPQRPNQYPEDDIPPAQFTGRPQQGNTDPQQKYTTPVPIIRFDKEQSADGSYKTSYETGNNIIAEETGFLKNQGIENEEALVQHGSYSYTAPDGSIITVTYTADEQGFRAEGAHLPTPPPVPEEIQKSLDLIYAQIKIDQEQEAKEQKFAKPTETNNFSGEDNYPNRFRP